MKRVLLITGAGRGISARCGNRAIGGKERQLDSDEASFTTGALVDVSGRR
ncbi:MAG TPA: hypothetical protein VFQ61_12950 [Polyangiaceae bacterium]|nr:hypothetical protein [Polyangiaceae bacterium]